MHATYRAAYIGAVPESRGGGESSTSSSDEETSRGYQPQPGDGFPPVIGTPNLYTSLRIITTDPTPRSKNLHDLHSTWMHLATGWTQGYNDSFLADMVIPDNY